jgi:oxygen-dependent protoporphyrinogen oxidase
VADITRRRLGHEVTARLVDPLIGGIHAGDTDQMSAAAVFPALLDAAARGGSLMRALRATTAPTPPSGPNPGAPPGAVAPVFYTVRGGLSRLIETLGAALRGRGVEVRLQSPVDRLELRPTESGAASEDGRGRPRWTVHSTSGPVDVDAVIIAAPTPVAAALLEPIDRTVAGMLAMIDYADVTLATLRFPDGAIARPLDGTGFLVPASTGCLITACTWLTSKWTELQRPGDVLLRASMGRFGDDRPARMSDDEIVGQVVEDLGPMLGLHSQPMEAVVTRWANGFPQYGVGHVGHVSSIEQGLTRVPGLALAGAAYHGVGIPACIASGRRAGAAVLEHPATAGLTTR